MLLAEANSAMSENVRESADKGQEAPRPFCKGIPERTHTVAASRQDDRNAAVSLDKKRQKGIAQPQLHLVAGKLHAIDNEGERDLQ